MLTQLYEYLILHQRVSLPGIGTIHLRRSPSRYDVADKSFTPPSYHFELSSGDDFPSKNFFEWLSHTEGLTEWEAIRRLNDFAFELRKDLSAGREIEWNPVGILKKDFSGRYILEARTLVPLEEETIRAEKLVRDNVQHHVLVGEREMRTGEMESLLSGSFKKSRKTKKRKKVQRTPAIWKERKWLVAMIICVLSFLFIALYFSQNGLNTSATGNKSRVDARPHGN